ncbi:MAG: hypothetical protein AAGF24_13990 [Cyanobacteria bacterium P01_H01_bin.121]
MTHYAVLTARLRNELKNLSKVLERAKIQVQKARTAQDDDYWFALALSLQNYYMGIERIFEDIAKHVDQTLPTGPNSHQALVEQMSLDIPQTRPAVITHATLQALTPYRGFRHVVIHRYGFELKPELIEVLASDLEGCYAALHAEIETFCQFLLQLKNTI